ncbi:MAG: hypothetical protein V3V67_13635 [Myxococcota bacterium]
MSGDLTPRSGDIGSFALYAPDRDDAIRALAERGWRRREGDSSE